MQIDLTKKEFRRLLDLVYIGNWILNSTRGEDRIEDYDQVESKLFALCREHGCTAAVLKEKSPSCGCGKIYDGTFSRRLTDGDGVTAALLMENGVRVYGESSLEGL